MNMYTIEEYWWNGAKWEESVEERSTLGVFDTLEKAKSSLSALLTSVSEVDGCPGTFVECAFKKGNEVSVWSWRYSDGDQEFRDNFTYSIRVHEVNALRKGILSMRES